VGIIKDKAVLCARPEWQSNHGVGSRGCKMNNTPHVSAALAPSMSQSKAMYSSTSLAVKVPLEKDVRVAIRIVTRIVASDVEHIGSELNVERFWDVDYLPPIRILRKAEGNLTLHVAEQVPEVRVRGLEAVPLVF
jgi:hypothetical protein